MYFKRSFASAQSPPFQAAEELIPESGDEMLKPMKPKAASSVSALRFKVGLIIQHFGSGTSLAELNFELYFFEPP